MSTACCSKENQYDKSEEFLSWDALLTMFLFENWCFLKKKRWKNIVDDEKLIDMQETIRSWDFAALSTLLSMSYVRWVLSAL